MTHFESVMNKKIAMYQVSQL